VATVETQILTMTEEQLDVLPVGIILLDRDGKILYYNKSQANLSRRKPETTVGLNFFRDVAPCAAVKAFQGRFDEFVTSSFAENLVEPFDFTFDFPWGSRNVAITLVRGTGKPETYFVVVSVVQVSA
jgi:photoactive yellow protein